MIICRLETFQTVFEVFLSWYYLNISLSVNHPKTGWNFKWFSSWTAQSMHILLVYAVKLEYFHSLESSSRSNIGMIERNHSLILELLGILFANLIQCDYNDIIFHFLLYNVNDNRDAPLFKTNEQGPATTMKYWISSFSQILIFVV